jgi:TIR domain-containing protein
LQIVPDLPGLLCDPAAVTVLWRGPVHEARFLLWAPPQLAGSVVAGWIRVWCGPLILGEVSVRQRVAAGGASPLPDDHQAKRQRVSRYRKIFPSYSRRDSAVVEQVAVAARALGDQYLQDVLTLRSGEKWRPRLLELIEEADVFQLFWSTNSMHSPHCRTEWEHALGLRQPDFVRPLYWEDPFPEAPDLGMPPDELRSIHFAHLPVPDRPSAPARRSVPAEVPSPARRSEADRRSVPAEVASATRRSEPTWPSEPARRSAPAEVPLPAPDSEPARRSETAQGSEPAGRSAPARGSEPAQPSVPAEVPAAATPVARKRSSVAVTVAVAVGVLILALTLYAVLVISNGGL